MNSPKVKTQKNLSSLIAIALAVVTLFSASVANSSTPVTVLKKARLVESEIIAQIDQMLLEEEEETILDLIEIDALKSDVKVFGNDDQLIGEGNTEGNKSLRKLVNKAELVSEFGNTKYYRIAK